jgi:hypothetical protein
MDQRDGNWKIRHNRSTDGGGSWAGDNPLTTSGSGSSNPTVAVSGDTVHVVWDDGRDCGFEVYYNRSFDKGQSWFGDTRLTYNYDGGGCSEALYPEVEAIGSRVHVVWEDNRDGNWEIYHIWDRESGDWWYTFPRDTDARLTYEQSESRRPAIAVGGEGELNLVWADDRDGNFEIYNSNYITLSTCPCGDCNNDGRVTFADALYLKNYYYQTPPGSPAPICDGDVNLDGRITFADALYIKNYYYQTPPGSPPPCQPPKAAPFGERRMRR